MTLPDHNVNPANNKWMSWVENLSWIFLIWFNSRSGFMYRFNDVLLAGRELPGSTVKIMHGESPLLQTDTCQVQPVLRNAQEMAMTSRTTCAVALHSDQKRFSLFIRIQDKTFGMEPWSANVFHVPSPDHSHSQSQIETNHFQDKIRRLW